MVKCDRCHDEGGGVGACFRSVEAGDEPRTGGSLSTSSSSGEERHIGIADGDPVWPEGRVAGDPKTGLRAVRGQVMRAV